jgi:hypothetical protein
MSEFYVYELRDPRDGSVFYVGKGVRDRINAHHKEAVAGRVSRKCDRIREILAAGKPVEAVKVRFFGNEQEAYDFEADLIQSYGLDRLTNVVPGGGTARNAPTIYADRTRIRVAAEMVARLGGGRVKSVVVSGQMLDLLPILEDFKAAAGKVIARRGFDWANKIAARFGVEFAAHG